MHKVLAIPAFSDNYIWALHDDSGRAVIVDPGDAAPVLAALDRHGLQPAAILITHHHRDHIGGVAALRERFPLPVYGPAEAGAAVTVQVADGDLVEFAEPRLRLRVLEVPGHTAGHVAYAGEGVLFCGDTLFAGGCGRLFEGTPAQMYGSLRKLAALPLDTRVYCAHEYTESNLRFALRVEPDNELLQNRLAAVHQQRLKGEITLPSTIELELQTNPFLRAESRSVMEHAERWAGQQLSSPDAVFAAVRAWKDAG